MEKKWVVREGQDEQKIEALRTALKVDRIVAELLIQRGIDNFEAAKKFFRPQLTDLHDPFLMKNMEEAVNRLNSAIENNERILLFGDYDVDGTTAVALMYSFLESQNVNVDFYIPDRYKEGYGLSIEGIDYAKKSSCKLIISLDCGIKSIDKVKYAREQGLDFIVCDHHEPGNLLPEAIILDQKQRDCPYPYKELSGCGVGFKLLQGLSIRREIPLENLYQFLDLLVLSIGADIVPVTGENRILCQFGLKQLNENPRTAFKELVAIAGKKFPLSLTDVVFTIAPRINAAGRINSGKTAVELMISENVEEIKNLASSIHDDNAVRRDLDSQITEEALAQIKNDSSYSQKVTTVVYSPDWHKGVVGIVASRLIENHYRPTIVLTGGENGIIGGSARSIDNINLYEVLEECEDLLIQFGGHSHAAGMTLELRNLEAFKKHFNEAVQKRKQNAIFQPIQEIDISIELNEIHKDEPITSIPRLKRIIADFEPHGPGNMKPVFFSSNLFTTDSRILKEEHLKLKVTQPNSKYAYDAIGFRLAEKEQMTTKGLPFEMVYTLETNEFNGKTTVQMNIKDIRSMVI
ncbi:MAG: exonuclease RecJ [Bacteroidota bacterium]|jgi:single-stranded-DNA-specific exonuclease